MSVIITRKTKELTPIEQYLMTIAPSIQSMKNCPDDVTLNVVAVCEYDDIKPDCSEVHLMSMLLDDNTVYSTQSETFKNSFKDIEELGLSWPIPVKKITGQSKAGRTFVDCVLDVNSL